MSKLFIPILLGTVRQERKSEQVARYLFNHLLKHSQVKTELVDVRKLNLPINDEGTSLRKKNPKWQKIMNAADGLLIVTPEYNHGYPGSLKRALDVLYEEYHHKTVAICSVSSGGFGGVRCIEQLVGVLRTVGLVLIQKDLPVSKIEESFDAKGKPVDPSFDKHMESFFEELIWMSNALKNARTSKK